MKEDSIILTDEEKDENLKKYLLKELEKHEF